MNFRESIANYVLGNYTTSHLSKVAEIAITEKQISESIWILAGMSEKDNPFEITYYFEKALKELNIDLPSENEAAKILIKFYLNLISKNPKSAFEIMEKIDREVYRKAVLDYADESYVGDKFKIENLYTWYREIQDWKDNGITFYFNDLSRDEQLKKLEENLVSAAREVFTNNYT